MDYLNYQDNDTTDFKSHDYLNILGALTDYHNYTPTGDTHGIAIKLSSVNNPTNNYFANTYGRLLFSLKI